MGIYRLFLAYLVVASHLVSERGGYHVGAMAVVSFFLLSGFVMTALIGKYYNTAQQVPLFYADRALRILPQFLLYSMLTVVAAWVVGLHHYWMPEPPSLGSTLLQLTVFPLNFYRLIPNMAIPQAWSLGLEAMFYLVFPFVLIFKLRRIAAGLSIIVFLGAYCGLIDRDLWAYRFLPGTLFIFVCGSWIATQESPFERCAPWVIAAGAALLLAGTYLSADLNRSVLRSVLSGVILGIPAVTWLRHREIGGSKNDLAGNLSYGVFLNHLTLLAAVEMLSPPTRHLYLIIPLCALSTLVSYCSFSLVEAPLIRWRREMRRRRVTPANPPPVLLSSYSSDGATAVR